MNDLNENWKPEFGSIILWLAMDKHGKIALMINNCWGDIPKILLSQANINNTINDLIDYLYEESLSHPNKIKNKNGEFELDLYGFWLNKNIKNHHEKYHELTQTFLESKDKTACDLNFVINKGLYIYQAIEGDQQGDDYPIGYHGHTQMGDYYRYLIPKIYLNIDEIPKELWCGIAVSKDLDFSKDRIIFNTNMNVHFTD
ncbi:hypothetical protein ACEYX6_10050 [Acinetobacter sp. c2-A9]